MKITVSFGTEEKERLSRLIARKNANNRTFIQHRIKHNVEGRVPEVDDDRLWDAHIMCLLTTQQRSGPDSPINKFRQQDAFPLTLSACRQMGNVRQETIDILTDAGGIRRTRSIGKAVARNLNTLEQSEWTSLHQWRDKLVKQRTHAPIPHHRKLEEEAAAYIQDTFYQFGPKQSRNFWQSLGLTRYVFVLDSRILKRLREYLNGTEGILSSSGLGDRAYYQFMSQLLGELCAELDVLPCVFDAVLFDTFDENAEWNPDSILF